MLLITHSNEFIATYWCDWRAPTLWSCFRVKLKTENPEVEENIEIAAILSVEMDDVIAVASQGNHNYSVFHGE